MALSKRTKAIVEIGLADRRAAAELSAAVDAAAAPIAATITNGDTSHAPSGDAVYDALALKADLRSVSHIAALGATSNLVGVDGTGSNAAPLAGTEARLDAI